jgi:phage shock protein PspC (stress-responsive transcriptional regulator)
MEARIPAASPVVCPGREGTMAANGLRRSRRRRMIGGVCGGFAEWVGWDPTLVRVLYVTVSVCSAAFPGILVYLVLWVVMPEGD